MVFRVSVKEFENTFGKEVEHFNQSMEDSLSNTNFDLSLSLLNMKSDIGKTEFKTNEFKIDLSALKDINKENNMSAEVKQENTVKFSFN